MPDEQAPILNDDDFDGDEWYCSEFSWWTRFRWAFIRQLPSWVLRLMRRRGGEVYGWDGQRAFRRRIKPTKGD